MRAVIIGCSAAGASEALALSKDFDVSVYEKAERQNIGKKTCANVVTKSFVKYAKEIGLNPKRCIISEFRKAFFFSEKNDLFLRTKEFKIDRQKFVDMAIDEAMKRGAKFEFETEFLDFKKENGKFAVKLRKKGKEFLEKADILIGADGALSEVAKKAGLWGNRKFFLCMQTEVPAKKLKFRVEKDAYYIFARKEFGYYSYIFPLKGNVVVGTGNNLQDDAKKNYNNFMKFLGIKPGKISAAVIPIPQRVHFKKNLFLIGDAACSTKFSGGGIVPAIVDAIAVRNILVKNDLEKFRTAKKRVFMNRRVAKAVMRMKNRDFDYLLKIMREKKFEGLLEKRDEFERSEYLKALDIRFLRFLFKAI